MSKEFLIDAIDCFISGDWGTDSYSIDAPIKVNCIRGADINNINSNDVVSIPTRYISERSLTNKMLSVGDIVVEKSGGSPTQSTGRVAYISEPVVTSSDTVCSNFCTAFRVKDKWDSKYIYYYLRYIYDLGIFFNFEGKTSGIKNLDLERAYKSIPIKYIPKEKQQKIVKVLALLDKKIELNNKIISELEQMAKELYDYWFVQFDFPDANGRPYRSSGGKMVYNPTLKREIPEGWEASLIKNWIESEKGGDWGSDEESGNYSLKVSCIRGADINGVNGNGSINAPLRFINKNNTDKLLSNGDVIIEISGGSPTQSTGRAALVTDAVIERFSNPIICSNFCKALTLKYMTFRYNFIYEWQRVYDSGALFGFEGKTSGIKNFLYDAFIKSFNVATPPKYLREKFVAIIDPLNYKNHKLLNENKELATLRDWLLPMLMNGQVTVHAETKEETKKETPRINLSQQRNQRFELWLSNQGVAARGEIDKATLREIFDAMDEDDK